MYQSTYFVDKSTNTFADSLLAYGLATVLRTIFPDGKEPDVRIKDEGIYYAINLEEPIQANWVENAQYFHNGVNFILTDKMKKRGITPGISNITDYETHKKRRADYFEARKKLPKEARRPGATVDEFPELQAVLNLEPHPYWDIWAQVNQMSAISAYNGMVLAWAETRDCFPDMLKIILKLFAQTPNNTNEALSVWKKLAKEKNLKSKPNAAATQVYNPANGKGSNRAKADSLTIGGPKNFWPVEYLKLVGMQHAGLPRVVSGTKDRKTYVLLPKNIKLGTSNKVFKEFQKALWASTAIKMDIIAALRYARLFLRQWLDGQITDEFSLMMGMQPGDHVQGLAMAYYKDMGSALAVLNQSTINLPRWAEKITTREEAKQFIEILEEHEHIIQNLKEDRGLEYDMLYQYRSFLSGGDLRDFFEFSASYSSYLTNKIEAKDYVTQFTTKNLEVLMKSKNEKLTPILENEGFRNVAHAIRQATVNAQWAKIHNQRVYDVQYGLGAELKRKANYNDDFVQTLTDFMQSYNQETVQMAERHKGNPPRRRKQITTDDIAQVIELIDRYGAKTVGNMLIAFGYAKESKTPETESE